MPVAAEGSEKSNNETVNANRSELISEILRLVTSIFLTGRGLKLGREIRTQLHYFILETIPLSSMKNLHMQFGWIHL